MQLSRRAHLLALFARALGHELALASTVRGQRPNYAVTGWTLPHQGHDKSHKQAGQHAPAMAVRQSRRALIVYQLKVTLKSEVYY